MEGDEVGGGSGTVESGDEGDGVVEFGVCVGGVGDTGVHDSPVDIVASTDLS